MKIFLLSCVICILASCSKYGDHNSKVLNGIYYGYENNSKNLYILIFDKDHKNAVGLVKEIDMFKASGIFPIDYKSNYVFINANGKSEKFKISRNKSKIICLSCNGVSSPKIYHLGTYKGKKMSNAVVKSAFIKTWNDSNKDNSNLLKRDRQI